MNKTHSGEQFAIETPKGHLEAHLHSPAVAHANGQLVMMLHGFSGNRHEINGFFERMAGRLADRGYFVARFDFRGCGESHGDTTDIYPSAQVEDTFWAVEYVRSLEELRHVTACHLIGFSFGGVVAALSAIDRPELFETLTIWEGPFDLGRELKRVFEPVDWQAVWEQGYLQNGESRLSKQLFEELDHLGLAHGLGNYSGPVLVISGAADPIVPHIPNHQEWLNSLPNARVTEAVIAGADHGFTGPQQENEAFEITAAFLAREHKGK